MSNPCSEDPSSRPGWGEPPGPDDGKEYEDYLDWQKHSQKCAELEDKPTDEDVKSRIPDILAGLGVESCKSETGGGWDWTKLKFFAGVKSSGCEQIQVLASTLLMQTRVQMCTLNKIVQQQDEQTSIKQKISVEAFEGSIIECKGNLTLGNKVKINKINKLAFSSAMSSAMSAEILQTIVESFQQQQAQETGFLATSAGQRLISDVLTEINTDIMLQTINCSIQTVLDRVTINNEIKISIGPRSILRADDCTFQNDTEVQKVSESIVLSSMQTVMDVQAVIDYFKEMSVFQDNKAAGFGLGFGLIILALIVAGALVIGGFFKYGSQVMDKRGTQVLIICITIVTILGIIIGVIVKIKADQREFDRKYPPCPEDGPCVPCEEGKRCGGDEGKNDEGRPPDPNAPCQTITLIKTAKGYSWEININGPQNKRVTEYIVFEGWDHDQPTITVCVKDFVTAFNNSPRTYMQDIGFDNKKLWMGSVDVPAWGTNQPFTVTGQIDLWRRMGFNTSGLRTTTSFNASKEPFK